MVSWTAKRSNQSILKEISPQYSLEGLMLKLQYLGHLMQITDSLEKTLMPGKTEDSKEINLKEINPEYSLEGLMLKLKLQYFGHVMRRSDLLEKILMLSKIEGRRRRG